MSEPLRIATVQFPVSADVARNGAYVRRWMRRAAARGARVVHFPETALSGYGPRHFAAGDAVQWPRETVPAGAEETAGALVERRWGELSAQTEGVARLAAELGLWVVLGSAWRVDHGLPRNSLLVISPDGAIAARYDKRRLYGVEHRFYSPGDTPCVLDIDGHRCGFLICYDNCFPALFEAYRDAGVGLLFLSFYNAGRRQQTALADLMRANLIVRAADHGMWISASNSCERHAPLAAGIFRPDGSAVEAPRHVAGMAVDDYPLAELGWTYYNRTFGESLANR